MSDEQRRLLTAHDLHRFRHWERSNLPISSGEAAYLLFLRLATEETTYSGSLKELYLSMPYAESTVRLLFRELEQGGWIEVPRKEADKRARTFVLSEKFHSKREEWLDAANRILNER